MNFWQTIFLMKPSVSSLFWPSRPSFSSTPSKTKYEGRRRPLDRFLVWELYLDYKILYEDRSMILK